MKMRSMLVLSVNEAREGLVQFYADTIINDRPNLVEVIRSNNFHQIVPNLPSFTPEQIADLFGELNLGEKLARKYMVATVVVETTADSRYVVVFDIENLAPQERFDVLLQSRQAEV